MDHIARDASVSQSLRCRTRRSRFWFNSRHKISIFYSFLSEDWVIGRPVRRRQHDACPCDWLSCPASWICKMDQNVSFVSSTSSPVFTFSGLAWSSCLSCRSVPELRRERGEWWGPGWSWWWWSSPRVSLAEGWLAPRSCSRGWRPPRARPGQPPRLELRENDLFVLRLVLPPGSASRCYFNLAKIKSALYLLWPGNWCELIKDQQPKPITLQRKFIIIYLFFILSKQRSRSGSIFTKKKWKVCNTYR